MTTVQYITTAMYDAEMFKVIKTDNESEKHLKILKQTKRGEPCNLLFIKSKKIKNCELVPRKYYSLKVKTAGKFMNKPVLKYDLKQCSYNIGCSIDYSSDND